MRPWLLFLFVGAGLELIAILSVLSKDSIQPLSNWQMVVGYTQVPGASVFAAFGVPGQALDRLPSPLGAAGAIVIFGLAFLTQAAGFALAVWLVWIAGKCRRPPKLQSPLDRWRAVSHNR
jgi:hypothetical protein